MTRVIVILPVHNGANYLESSIRSVLAQDQDDFVLHVLDDGSTDASPDIARSTGDPRVRYSKNPGRFGLFRTLNRGCAEADSSLVRIWAHDDLMLPGSLRRFVDFADEHPTAGMIYCDFHEIDATGRRTGRDLLYQAQRERTPVLAGADLSAALFLCFGCLPGNISTVMLRRKAWEEAGGFLEDIQQAPDYDMWVRVSQLSEVGFLREKLIELRSHPLQLGKVGQKQMTTILEELPIYHQLRQLLKHAASEDRIARFWRHHRGRQHAHWIAKAFLTGDFSTAARGWGYLRSYRQCWRQMAFWLFSANGRFGITSSEKFFDELVLHLKANPGFTP